MGMSRRGWVVAGVTVAALVTGAGAWVATRPTLDVEPSDTAHPAPFTLRHGDPGPLACGEDWSATGRTATPHDQDAVNWGVGISSGAKVLSDDGSVFEDPHSVWLGFEVLRPEIAVGGFPRGVDVIAYAVVSRDGVIVGVAELPVAGYSAEPEFPAIAPLECMGTGVAKEADIGDDSTYVVSLVVQAVDAETGDPLATYLNPGNLGPRAMLFTGWDNWLPNAWNSDGAPSRIPRGHPLY